MFFWGSRQREDPSQPLVKEAHRLQEWVPQTPCLCGGGRRLFETSSAAFLICKIGAGIPYLAEVRRRLISICRAMQKTKHKAKQRAAAWQGGCSREQGQTSATAGAQAPLISVDGVRICKSWWRALRARQEAEGVTVLWTDTQSQKPWQAEAECACTLQGTPA